MKISCSSVSFRCSTVWMLFVFVLVAFISVTGTSTAVYAETWTVNTTIDDVSDSGSLRYAIENATSQDVITFHLEYPAIITLSDQLSIEHGLTIQGPGAENLAVSGGGECRVFYIETPESVNISGISIVSGDSASGGGMFNYNSSPTLTNCTFSGNSADKWGGGMCNSKSDPTVMSCTFSWNSAGELGGGMYNHNISNPTVTNCTFSSNSAVNGGGMRNSNSSPTVTNCTFSENSAKYVGGMLNYSSSPSVTNCIFWNAASREIRNDFSTTTLGYCVVQSDDYAGSTILEYVTSADPMLQPLADNGGPTWTCALGEGSSAIDSGITVDGVSMDQRGVIRPQGGTFDIGAYEAKYFTINSYCNPGGSISPESARVLWEASMESTDFYIFPDSGYEAYGVYVDGDPVSYDEVNCAYTFKNLSDDHILMAFFIPSDDNDDDDDDDDDGDGCNISALPGMGFLLLLPLLFLSGTRK